MAGIHTFSSTYAADSHRQAVVTLKIYNSGWDCLGATHFLTFRGLVRVTTHILGTTVPEYHLCN